MRFPTTPVVTTDQGTRTRRRLLASARTLFGSQGYAATSMRQVADRAGLALSGIYNHVASKEALFLAVLVEDCLDGTEGSRWELAATDRRDGPNATVSDGRSSGFIGLILVEIVEFGGKHLPKLRDHLSRERSMRLGLAVSHFLTVHLLTGLAPAGTRTTLSAEAFTKAVLQSLIEPESLNELAFTVDHAQGVHPDPTRSPHAVDHHRHPDPATGLARICRDQ